jgi:uncharacterized protein involved in cysteine biosynthesis
MKMLLMSNWLPLLIAVALAALGFWLLMKPTNDLAASMLTVMGGFSCWLAAIVLAVTQLVIWIIHSFRLPRE